jgi:hypothetical protein
MQQHLEKLVPVAAGDDLLKIVSAGRINAIQGAIRALAAGENITTEGAITKLPGHGKVRLCGRREKSPVPRQRRFQVSHSTWAAQVYVGDGAVYWDDGGGSGGGGEVFAEPREPTLDGVLLSGNGGDRPAFDASSVEAGVDYEVTCVFSPYAARVELKKASERPEPGDGWVVFLLARMKFKTAGGALMVLDTFEQVWESDILWAPVPEDGSGGSESSGESGLTGYLLFRVQQQDYGVPSGYYDYYWHKYVDGRWLAKHHATATSEPAAPEGYGDCLQSIPSSYWT